MAILMGVAGGESLNTTPLQHGKTFAQLIPDRYATPADAQWVNAGANMPDHYPQETRNGRIEVPELRSYILRRERPPMFAYLEYEPAEPAQQASADETPPDAEAEPSAPLNPQLRVQTVPGTLEHAALPVGDEVVLEASSAHIARADAISAELKRGAMAWEVGGR